VSAAIESEIAVMENYDDRQMFLEDLGLHESGVARLIQSTYRILNLATYFTAGVQEVRAWTITKGTLAPQAAAVIHTDFEKGFIRAEVIRYKDFVELARSCLPGCRKLACREKTMWWKTETSCISGSMSDIRLTA